MFRSLLFILLFIAFSNKCISQKSSELGVEHMRYYGQGFKSSTAGARYESFTNKSSWSIGLTYILPSKSTYGSSRGLGMYAGYRYGFGGWHWFGADANRCAGLVLV